MSGQKFEHRSAIEIERLRRMGFDELNDLLLQLSEQPESAQRDASMEVILEVMSEKTEYPYTLTEEERSVRQEDFWENYCGTAFETETDVVPESPPIYASSQKNTPRKPMNRILRGLAIAALIAALLCCAGAAFGARLYDRMLRWNHGTVRFLPLSEDMPNPVRETDEALTPAAYTPAFDELKEALASFGVQPQLPEYLPGELTLDQLYVESEGENFSVDAAYTYDGGKVNFDYSYYPNPGTTYRSYYHANEGGVATCVKDGTMYYFLRNNEKLQIIWFEGDLECSISGNFTEEEARKMVDSIP